MQFHHNGYVSQDPRVLEPASYGVDRASELPDTMDVLIVGSGPAGMITAAQLAMFPSVNTRIIERRPHRLIPVSYTHLTLPTTARRCRSRWSPYH